MTKNQARREFERAFNITEAEDVLVYFNNDKPALRTAWNDFTDMLLKERKITEDQYNNWTSPYNNV